MTEKEIIKQIKNDMNVGEFYDKTEDAIKGLLDLYNKQKEEIEELKTITNSYNSYNVDNMNGHNIIIADSEYFANGTFVEKYISKDKIRNLLPKINGSISHFKSKNDNHIVKRIKRKLEDL